MLFAMAIVTLIVKVYKEMIRNDKNHVIIPGILTNSRNESKSGSVNNKILTRMMEKHQRPYYPCAAVIWPTSREYCPDSDASNWGNSK